METQLHIFNNFQEDPTIADLAGLLYYATQFAGGDLLDIFQLGDKYSTVCLPAKQATVDVPSNETNYVTPARGVEVRNSFEDLIGRLDAGVMLEIRATPRRRTATRIASAAWRPCTYSTVAPE